MRLFLDANVLLLLIVGSIRPDRIGGKRLKAFRPDDFVQIADLARKAQILVTTPHVLTEVSNHLGSGPQQLVPGGMGEFAKLVPRMEELNLAGKEAVARSEFASLGLTDTCILLLADRNTTVVTMDRHLFNRLSEKGVPAINPLHSWEPPLV